MNAIDFCFWLQGYFEISDDGNNNILTAHQTTVIQDHLKLVFVHEIDPLREGQTPATPNDLNTAHQGNDSLIRC